MIAALFLIIGALFVLVAGLGVNRMPDVFCRMQASSKASTLGVSLIALGVAIHFHEVSITSRALVIVSYLFLTAPVGAHMIARAAHFVEVELFEATIADEYSELRDDEVIFGDSSRDASSR